MKKIVFFAIALSVITCTNVSATVTPQAQSKGVLLARVNMYDATVQKSIRTGYYDVSFTLTTKDPEQSNVLYKVSFVEKMTPTETNTVPKTYSYTFNRPITLTKDKSLAVEDTLPVPKDLEGLYTVTVSVFNNKGLPLAISKVKDIRLTSNIDAPFTIENCILSKKIYEPNTAISGKCIIEGSASTTSTLVSTLTYGNELNPIHTSTISIKNSTASFTLPSLTKAGVYTLTVQARDGNSVIGSSFIIRFIVNGAATTILSITTDKQSYTRGDVAHVGVGINVFTKKVGELYGVATIKSLDKMTICGGPLAVSVTRLGSFSFDVPILKDCNGYTVSVTVTDEKDSVLDKSTLTVKAEQAPQVIGYLNYFLIIGAIIVLLSSLIARRTKNK